MQAKKRIPSKSWGCSSAGRAPALQAGGQEFDPPHLHQRDEDKNKPNERKAKQICRFFFYKEQLRRIFVVLRSKIEHIVFETKISVVKIAKHRTTASFYGFAKQNRAHCARSKNLGSKNCKAIFTGA